MGKAARRKRARREPTRELSSDDVYQLLRLTRDDLLFLRETDFSRHPNTSVRVASSILRRLLHEGTYENSWRLVGLAESPVVSAVDLTAVVANVPGRYIEYAYAGGAKTGGAHHRGYVLLRVPAAEVAAEGQEAVLSRVQGLVGKPLQRDYSLAEFSASPSVVSGEASISRVEVVRYVANKLGGVHWDNRRGDWSDALGSRHRLLDERHLVVAGLPAPHYEVLSIAQALAQAPDTTTFIKHADTVFPEAAPSPEILTFREGRVGKYTEMNFSSTLPDAKASEPEPAK